jgi:DNA-directed RNA polymerase subunit beta
MSIKRNQNVEGKKNSVLSIIFQSKSHFTPIRSLTKPLTATLGLSIPFHFCLSPFGGDGKEKVVYHRARGLLLTQRAQIINKASNKRRGNSFYGEGPFVYQRSKGIMLLKSCDHSFVKSFLNQSGSPMALLAVPQRGGKGQKPKSLVTGLRSTKASGTRWFSNIANRGLVLTKAQKQKRIEFLDNYQRSNQDTCLVHKPAVYSGEWLETGDLMADSSASMNGELAIGKNILVAYMPWEGYNYEDAILINERLVYDDVYTSIHIERYEIEIKENQLGFEQMTREIPDVSPESISHLDSYGIANIGSWVEEGDILVGKVTPLNKNQRSLSPYQRLLYKLLEKKVNTVRDSSLRAPKGIKANVINVQILGVAKRGSGVSEPNSQNKSKDPKRFELNAQSHLCQKDPPAIPLIPSPCFSPLSGEVARKTKGRWKQMPKSDSRDAPFRKAPREPNPYSAKKVTQDITARETVGKKANRLLLNNNVLPFKQIVFERNQTKVVRNNYQWEKLTPGCLKKTYKKTPWYQKISSIAFSTTKNLTHVTSWSRKQHFLNHSPKEKVSLTQKLQKPLEFHLTKLNKKGIRFSTFFNSAYTFGYLVNKTTLLASKPPEVRGSQRSPREGAQRIGTKGTEEVVYRSNKQILDQFKTGASKKVFTKHINIFNKILISMNHLDTALGGYKGLAPLLNSKNRNPLKQTSNPNPLILPTNVHIYLAEKRKIQVGDKMAGRHGNKGIVSNILPRQDMPYLPDGTALDIVLNPLGVPSRMNVGQIYECLLGLAGRYLGEHYKIFPFDEIYGAEASRSFVFAKLFEARKKVGVEWLFDPDSPGKMRLFDGRTGESFDQPVTVGIAYMLKLVHMVDDKIHARSTGPYSLVTQQPLRGRAKQGGQRLGEMEVWAIEGYGAAFVLLEMLTIKSDDMTGRLTLWSNLILNKEITIGTPESFKVLVCELQALCLDIGLYHLDPQQVSSNGSLSTSGEGPTRTLKEISHLMLLP